MAALETVPQARDAPSARAFGPLSAPQLWRLLNTPRDIDGEAVRGACLLMVIFYLVSSVVRQVPGHPEVWWLRGSVLAFAAAGVVWGPRFGWRALRGYTLAFAILLPAVTASVALVRGNPSTDVAVTALAVFAPMVFLQTGVDVGVATLVLALASTALLAAAPPLGLPVEAAAIMLAGALVGGGTTALVLIAFRGRIGESTTWWQEACARERALREFTELATPHLGDAVLAREFAARFHAAFGPGQCAIVIVDPADRAPSLAALAGVVPASAGPTAAALAHVLAMVATRQPAVLQPLDQAALNAGLAGLPWLVAGGVVVALPIVVDERVDGVVVLSAARPRAIAGEDLLLWRAMAAHVGAAIGSARLFSRLQEALRARGEFVDTMSHELRSPLHVILGYADMLAEGRHDVPFLVARIRASALELLQLVENTLALARLGTGKLRVHPSEFDLRELIEELRESTGASPEKKDGVAVCWEVAADAPRVRLDRLKVKEIVHNLVSNALKFTERGTVTVRIGRDGERLRIDVEDTGSGIPSAARERIFEMFERVEPAGGARAGGVGLGLYIVKSLVQLMGGLVTLESTPERGSRFTVWLPLAVTEEHGPMTADRG